jgi:hypothetical protein
MMLFICELCADTKLTSKFSLAISYTQILQVLESRSLTYVQVMNVRMSFEGCNQKN